MSIQPIPAIGGHKLPPLSDFRGAYSGRVAILCSGTTSAEQDLSRVECPILGVNASYRVIAPTFAHLVSGIHSAGVDVPIIRASYPQMPLFTWKLGHGAIAIERAKFSLDAEQGIHWHSAALASLQLVIYMGFTQVVYIGLDLKRRGAALKAWEVAYGVRNAYDPSKDYLEQRIALRNAATTLATLRPDVDVVNVSHDTLCDAFRVKPFDQVFA